MATCLINYHSGVHIKPFTSDAPNIHVAILLTENSQGTDLSERVNSCKCMGLLCTS